MSHRSKNFITPAELKNVRQQLLSYQEIIRYFSLEIEKITGADIWIKTPWTGEKTASLIISPNKGAWKTFSGDQEKSGGGPLELIQELFARSGKQLDIYRVGIWAEENLLLGQRRQPAPPRQYRLPEKSKEVKKENNTKNKTDLTRYFSLDHPAFVQEVIENRGISRQTAIEMGFGYLPKSNYPVGKRIVFQICSLERQADKSLKPIIVTHQGRALTPEAEGKNGKYWAFPYPKSSTMYNLDKVLLTPKAKQTALEQNQIIIVEGCFDAAKLWEAGICNVVSSLGANLCPEQIPLLKSLSAAIQRPNFLVWYDGMDKAAKDAQGVAVSLLEQYGFEASGFNWEQGFDSAIGDPCDFSVEQLQNMQKTGVLSCLKNPDNPSKVR